MKSNVRSLSVQAWRALSLEGGAPSVRIQLNGYSMQPLVRRLRDTVTIIPLARPLKTGDVVLFCSGGERYVVHRVYRLQEGRVQTFGDNCPHPDSWLAPEQIWGLVTHVQRGRFTLHIDTPAWRALGRLWLAAAPVRLGVLRVLRGVRRRLFPRKKADS